MHLDRPELSQIHDRNGSVAILLLAVPLLAATLSLVPLRQTGESLEQQPSFQASLTQQPTEMVESESRAAAAAKLRAAASPQMAVSDEKAAALARLVVGRADDVANLRNSVTGSEPDTGRTDATVVPVIPAPKIVAATELSPQPKILGTVPASRLGRASTGPSLPATIQVPVQTAKQLQIAQAAAQARRHAANPAGGTATGASNETQQDSPVIADQDLAKRAASLFADSEPDSESAETPAVPATAEHAPTAATDAPTLTKKAAEKAPAAKTDQTHMAADESPAPAASTATGTKEAVEQAPAAASAPAPVEGKPLRLTRDAPAKAPQPLGWVVRHATPDGVSEEALDGLGRAPMASSTQKAPATTPAAEAGTRLGSTDDTSAAAPRKVAAPATQNVAEPEVRVTAAPSRLPANSAVGVAGHKMQAQILFQEHSAILTPDAQADLAALAQRLVADSGDQILLFGYSSDDVDKTQYSAAYTSEEKAARARLLSLSRTMAVRRFLMGHGVPSHRLFGRALGNRYASGPANRVDIMLGQL